MNHRHRIALKIDHRRGLVLRPKSHKNLRYHGDLGIETKSLISPKRYWPRMSDLTPIDNSSVVEFPKDLVWFLG